MRREQAIFNLEIKKKSGLSINPDIHHSKVFSSELLLTLFNLFTTGRYCLNIIIEKVFISNNLLHCFSNIK